MSIIICIIFLPIMIYMAASLNYRVIDLNKKYNVLCNVLAGEIDGAKIIKELTEGKRKEIQLIDPDLSLTIEEFDYIRNVAIKNTSRVDCISSWKVVKNLWLENTIFLGKFNGYYAIYMKTKNHIWKIYNVDNKTKEFMKYNSFGEECIIMCGIILDPATVIKLLNDFRNKN